MLLDFALNSDSIQIISVIIGAIVSIAAAFIAALYTEKYRDQNENRTEHYKQIKVNVLNPMLNQTDQYYLPILEFAKANLHWTAKNTKKFAVGLTEEPTISEVVACIVPSNASSSIIIQGEDEKALIEKELYEDCKKNHFNKLFKEWENLNTKANDFNQESLKLANIITESISKKLGLPIVSDWNLQGQYVTPYCGVAIFNRMAGTLGYQLGVTQNNSYQMVSFGNVIIQLDLSADIQKVKSILDDEIKERKEGFIQLKAKAESIDKEFVVFRAKLETLTDKQRLSGKCNYV